LVNEIKIPIDEALQYKETLEDEVLPLVTNVSEVQFRHFNHFSLSQMFTRTTWSMVGCLFMVCQEEQGKRPQA